MFKPVNHAEFVGGSVIKEGDTENVIQVRLMDADMDAEDLSGATVTWSLATNRGRLVEERAATILGNGSDGLVSIQFEAGDSIGWGTLYLQFNVTRSGDSDVEKFPADSQLVLLVTPSHENLVHTPTSFASLATVKAELQAQFDEFAAGVTEGTQGVGLTFTWDGTRLGVKREDESTFSYTDLAGAKGEPGSPGETGPPGTPGVDGRSVEFNWNGYELGVRQEGQTEYAYVNLRGAPGADGKDGTGVEIRGTLDSTAELPTSGQEIGHAYLINTELWVWGGTDWENAGTIQGPKGDTGEPGVQGVPGNPGKNLEFVWNGYELGVRQEGQTTYSYVNLRGEKGAVGETGSTGDPGTDGKSIEFTWDGTRLGVRQQGTATYTYTDLKGDTGSPGEKGDPGNDLEFTWNGTQLGVRQAGTATYSYVDLKGEIGDTGPTGDTGAPGEKGDPGNDLEFVWNGTALGVRQEGQVDYSYVDLKGATGDQGIPGEKGDPGADGVSLEFNWNGYQLGVRQAGTGTYSYQNLRGAQGEQGPPGEPGTDAIVLFEPRTSDPSSPSIGQAWLRTDL